MTNIHFFAEEIYRAYLVLGAKGYCQNVTDIEEWKKKGAINKNDYDYLCSLNRKLEKQF